MTNNVKNKKNRPLDKGRQKQKKQETKNLQITKNRWRKIFPSVGKLLIVVATVVSLIAGALYILPDISVIPFISTDNPQLPLTTYFTFINDGPLFPIHINYIFCHVIDPPEYRSSTVFVKLKNRDGLYCLRVNKQVDFKYDFTDGEPVALSLVSKENFTQSLLIFLKGYPPMRTDIDIIVVYRPWFLWETKKLFGFSFIRDQQGSWTWIPRRVNKKYFVSKSD